MLFSRKKHTNRIETEEDQLLTEDCGELLVPSGQVTDALTDGVKVHKRGLLRLLISLGILIVFGVSLSYLVPYAKALTGRTYHIAPTLIVNVLLTPMFWFLLGWTLMQALNAIGLVNRKQTRLKPVIHIAIVVLILLYIAGMLPFLIESIKSMILFQMRVDSSESFSYTFDIPLIFQDIAYFIMILSRESGTFTALGVILWVSGSEKRRNRRK